MAYKIAILDEEQSERDEFVNFFEDAFEVYEISELSSVDDLIDTIKGEHIDAIAIDYRLREHGNYFQYNGDYYFKKINEILIKFPAFILTNDPENAKRESPKIIPFFILNKNKLHSKNPDERKSFLGDINSYINSYKLEIENKLQELHDLTITKERNGKLSPPEEDTFVELNNFLDKAMDSRSAIPKTFYSQDTTNTLNDILESSNQILQKLSQKK
jgi:hypothetical protein